MSLPQTSDPACSRPPALEDLRRQLHQRLDQAIDACQHDYPQASFLDFEKALLSHLSALGLLLCQLFLLLRHARLDLTSWLQRGLRVADPYATRQLNTPWGKVLYGRAYLSPRHDKGSGVHPLDAQLGLTRDGFSPLLISWFCRLATRLSFRWATELGSMFLGWAPAPSTLEDWVLGLGRPAHVWLNSGPLPQDDGDILVIEGDGKAVPTATEEELSKRRGPRQRKPRACPCNCQRHRGRTCRKARGPKKKRKRGDKSKNGRSATLIAMYTLKRGSDGRLHGPCNKKIYASFSSRKQALQWAREQATRRGFGPDSAKTVQLVVDGESCLGQGLRELFPKAILTLDIRHAQERLWRVGRLLHAEGSAALAAWVEPLSEQLYEGQAEQVVQQLQQLTFRGPGSKQKRKVQAQAVSYLQKRLAMMKYQQWRQQDLVLASGVVEGAVRHVIGERLDQSGMRWVVEKGESLLLLRCIEVNGDWDAFFAWSEQQRQAQLRQGQVVQIRSVKPLQLPQLDEASEKRRRRRKAATAPPQEAPPAAAQESEAPILEAA